MGDMADDLAYQEWQGNFPKSELFKHGYTVNTSKTTKGE